jgi:hypothetical protein
VHACNCNTKYICDMVIVLFLSLSCTCIESVSVDMSLSRDRSFVLKILAASTDVGDAFDKYEQTVCKHVPRLPMLANNATSALIAFRSCLASWEWTGDGESWAGSLGRPARH